MAVVSPTAAVVVATGVANIDTHGHDRDSGYLILSVIHFYWKIMWSYFAFHIIPR